MSDKLEQLLDEYSVMYITDGQNSSKQYINIPCEGLGGCSNDQKFKLGIHRSGKFANCWACGSKPIKEVVASLGIPWNLWSQVIDEEEGVWERIEEKRSLEKPKKDIMIPGSDLHPVHKNYLRERGFDPDFLEKEFHLKGITFNGGYYKGTDFEFEDVKLQSRIIIPIYLDGKPISYLGRTYIKDVKNRYMCCIPELESYFHKYSFFNIDRAAGDRVILVEGTFDVMKLVQGSRNFNIIASYGTQITEEQLQVLRKKYKEVIIMYDGESKAQMKALYIKNYLESYGVGCRNLCLKGGKDPGELSDDEAKRIVKAVLGE